MNITLTIPKNLLKLDKVVNNALSDTFKTISLESDRVIGQNLQRYVYSYVPKTKNYKRTGRLLRGRRGKMISRQAYKIESNPQIAGARYNYASIVNKQKFRGGKYFDISYKEIKTLAKNELKTNIKKYVNQTKA